MAVGRRALNVPDLTLWQKLAHIHWPFVLLLGAAASVGFAMLYSAADGNFHPWASRQMVRFGFGLAAMIVVALIDVRIWLRYAYAFYLVSLALLAAVEVGGSISMGAQRWLDLGVFSVQPSEMMKIALVIALARYFHALAPDDLGRPLFLVPPVALVALPTYLVLRQPDLGTAMMLVLGSVALFFVAGVRVWKFVAVGLAGLLAMPVLWQMMREYQRLRVLTFLNPESDPLGAGYHVIQSKIALGSGGLFGKGFLQGTQSHLNFLPEMQTDFVFTMLAEEFGLVGGLALLGVYALVVVYGIAISLAARNQFGRLLGMGVTATFFLYVFINVAMVMGVVPVVGVPLPLVSYGGTAMLTLLLGFGLLLGVSVHRDVAIGRHGPDDAP
jgi:rod shape determining protein RodA